MQPVDLENCTVAGIHCAATTEKTALDFRTFH